MEERKALGKVLRRYRLERKLTQVQLAKLSGISRTTISQIERGECNTLLSTIYQLAVVLKVSAYRLFVDADV